LTYVLLLELPRGLIALANGTRISRRERAQRAKRSAGCACYAACGWGKANAPCVCPRHAHTAAQVHAPANTTLRPGATQNARTTSRPAGAAPHNGTRFSRREASAASEAVGWKRWLASVLERKF